MASPERLRRIQFAPNGEHAGAALLIGIAAVHVYLLTSQPALPMYFFVYTAILKLAVC
jgi:hypothetical protein